MKAVPLPCAIFLKSFFLYFFFYFHAIIVGMKNAFVKQCCNEESPKWKDAIHREIPIYSRNNDIRSEFERDYTRILHSEAYRRLKHKTQVFFAPHNDHICTRMEHVSHVASVASTIAKYLG